VIFIRFTARVEVVEYLGDELLAHLRVGDIELLPGRLARTG